MHSVAWTATECNADARSKISNNNITHIFKEIFPQVEKRILVSADTELNWLHQFKNLTAPYHQIIGVPVYEDGASCGKYIGIEKYHWQAGAELGLTVGK